MPDKDRIETLLKLADASWRDYSERRSIEWKANFALWAALGAFAGFMFQQQTALPIASKVVATGLLALVVLPYTFLWKVEVQARNHLDVTAAQYYWAKVDSELKISSPEVRQARGPRKGKTPWRRTHLSQVIITFMFMILAILAVWTPKATSSKSTQPGILCYRNCMSFAPATCPSCGSKAPFLAAEPSAAAGRGLSSSWRTVA